MQQPDHEPKTEVDLNMIDEGDLKNFTTELQVLCEKYNIRIGGCWCCDSPWLESFEGDSVYIDVGGEQDDGLYPLIISETETL